MVDISIIPDTLTLANTLKKVYLCEEEEVLLLPTENVPVTVDVETKANIESSKIYKRDK